MFVIQFSVEDIDMGQVMGKLPFDLLHNFKVNSIEVKEKRKKPVTYKQSKSAQLILKALEDNPKHTLRYEEIQDLLEQNGYSRSSQSPIVSGLYREGLVERDLRARKVWLK